MPIVLQRHNAVILTVKHYETDETSASSPVEESCHDDKKRVRFSATPCRYYENHSLCAEDNRDECWYTPSELTGFRRDAAETAREIAAVERRHRGAPFSYQRVLERTLDACTEAAVVTKALGYDDDDDNDDSCIVLSTTEQLHLQRWLGIASTRLGLERISIAKIGHEKLSRRRALHRLLRNEQRRNKQQQQPSSRGSVTESDSDRDEPPPERPDRNDPAAERLREACARISRPSRRFARTMAESLAAVVRNDYHYCGGENTIEDDDWQQQQ